MQKMRNHRFSGNRISNYRVQMITGGARLGWEMRIRIVHCYISLCLKDAHKNFKNKKNKNLKKKVADRCQN